MQKRGSFKVYSGTGNQRENLMLTLVWMRHQQLQYNVNTCVLARILQIKTKEQNISYYYYLDDKEELPPCRT